MTKKDKLVQKLLTCPVSFNWPDLCRLLGVLGYRESRAGKTSGSRCR